MAKIQKIFNISFVLNKKVLILFNTMNKMNKILSIFIPHWGIFLHMMPSPYLIESIPLQQRLP